MQSCSDNITDRIIAGRAITAAKADTTYRNTDKQMDSSPVQMKNLNKYMAYDMLNDKKKPLNDSDDDKSKARIKTKNKMLEDILMMQSQFNEAIIEFISSNTRQKPSRIRRQERRQNQFHNWKKDAVTPPNILRTDTPSLLMSPSPSTLADIPSLRSSPSQVTQTSFPADQQTCKIPGQEFSKTMLTVLQDNAGRVARPVTRIANLDNKKVAKPAASSEVDPINFLSYPFDIKILEIQNKEKDHKIDALNKSIEKMEGLEAELWKRNNEIKQKEKELESKTAEAKQINEQYLELTGLFAKKITETRETKENMKGLESKLRKNENDIKQKDEEMVILKKHLEHIQHANIVSIIDNQNRKHEEHEEENSKQKEIHLKQAEQKELLRNSKFCSFCDRYQNSEFHWCDVFNKFIRTDERSLVMIQANTIEDVLPIANNNAEATPKDEITFSSKVINTFPSKTAMYNELQKMKKVMKQIEDKKIEEKMKKQQEEEEIKRKEIEKEEKMKEEEQRIKEIKQKEEEERKIKEEEEQRWEKEKQANIETTHEIYNKWKREREEAREERHKREMELQELKRKREEIKHERKMEEMKHKRKMEHKRKIKEMKMEHERKMEEMEWIRSRDSGIPESEQSESFLIY